MSNNLTYSVVSEIYPLHVTMRRVRRD